MRKTGLFLLISVLVLTSFGFLHLIQGAPENSSQNEVQILLDGKPFKKIVESDWGDNSFGWFVKGHKPGL